MQDSAFHNSVTCPYSSLITLSAVVTTPEIARAFTQKIHFNTFAGNPVSCAAGKAVLETIERENTRENCAEVGSSLLNGLKQLQEEHESIGDVRGAGLMIGVDLVKNRDTKEADSELASRVHEPSQTFPVFDPLVSNSDLV